MQPSDFPVPFGRGFGSPCRRPTSMQRLVLSRLRVPLQTRSASETGHRLSAGPDSFEEKQGPPGLLGRPLRARHGQTPRRIRRPLAPTPRRGDPRRRRHRLHGKQNAGHPECCSFRGRTPMAHTLACLRLADRVTEIVARLATGSGGLTLGRAGFAPAGRQIEISWSHRYSSNPDRPAEPGRTDLPTPHDHSDALPELRVIGLRHVQPLKDCPRKEHCKAAPEQVVEPGGEQDIAHPARR